MMSAWLWSGVQTTTPSNLSAYLSNASWKSRQVNASGCSAETFFSASASTSQSPVKTTSACAFSWLRSAGAMLPSTPTWSSCNLPSLPRKTRRGAIDGRANAPLESSDPAAMPPAASAVLAIIERRFSMASFRGSCLRSEC